MTIKIRIVGIDWISFETDTVKEAHELVLLLRRNSVIDILLKQARRSLIFTRSNKRKQT